MSEASPRPWRVEENSLGWKTLIVDANGKDVASCWGGDGVNCTEPAQSDAALIVDAVNFYDATVDTQLTALLAERDRLRDIVQRLLMLRRGDIAVPMDMEKQILREARAAIGEEAR